MILLGGRTFCDSRPNIPNKSEFINKIQVLKMDCLEWQDILLSGDEYPPLFNFSSSIQNDEIYIFGGMQESYYQSKNLYRIDLEPKPRLPGSDRAEIDYGQFKNRVNKFNGFNMQQTTLMQKKGSKADQGHTGLTAKNLMKMNLNK